MIIKMTILRLLGSSDDKEKIDVARSEGPPLRCNELGTGLTDVGCFTLTGVMDLEAEETTGVLPAPVIPTIKAK